MAATTAMKPPHMETPSQVAREGDAAETSRDQAVVPRQSYNTGHGDFCFGRLFDKDNLPGYELQSPNGEGSNFRANNVLFIEKDGFQRSGHFKFNELPIEVRHRILDLLCAPCYDEDDCIEIEIVEFRTRDITAPGWWNQTFEQHQSGLHRCLRGPPSVSDEEQRKQFAEEQRRFRIANMPHPNRTNLYHMSTKPRLAWKKCGLFCFFTKDWSMFELIRNLSNVSAQFRQEFGDVFWRRTKIIMSVFDPNNDILSGFLEERPAVPGGIRHLEFALDFTGHIIDLKVKEDQRRFLIFLRTISTLSNLEQLSVSIYTEENQLCEFESESETRKQLEACRVLPVKEEFDLWLCIDASDSGRFDSSEEMNKYTEDLEAKWCPKIRELMLPNTLRAPEKLTETEKYLQSRPGQKSDAVKQTDNLEG
ncbi:hypothetical protein BGZ57DRAFT_930937 [Hyaloscypha finlandica]|nr:hypothetical protein BGZ57DRAFT_930937 [Hyaloscypha finlandica]